MPNAPRPGTHTRGIRMDDALWERAVRLAKPLGFDSASALVREAVLRYVNSHEKEE